MTVAKSYPLSWGLSFEMASLAGIKALLVSWAWKDPSVEIKETVILIWVGFLPPPPPPHSPSRAALHSQLQGLGDSRGVSLKCVLLPTSRELALESPRGPTEPSRQMSRAGEYSQEQSMLPPVWASLTQHSPPQPSVDPSWLPEPAGESPGS